MDFELLSPIDLAQGNHMYNTDTHRKNGAIFLLLYISSYLICLSASMQERLTGPVCIQLIGTGSSQPSQTSCRGRARFCPRQISRLYWPAVKVVQANHIWSGTKLSSLQSLHSNYLNKAELAEQSYTGLASRATWGQLVLLQSSGPRDRYSISEKPSVIFTV